jgi:hypothetical protein
MLQKEGFSFLKFHDDGTLMKAEEQVSGSFFNAKCAITAWKFGIAHSYVKRKFVLESHM